MKMNKTEQLLENDALFDDEATVLARPVVPLADAPEEMTFVSAGGQHPARAPRRPWLLGLVLVSALAGAVLGGTALYLMQGRRAAPSQPQQQQTSAPAPPQQSAEVTTTTAPAEEAPQPQAPAPQESHAAPPPAEPTKPEQEQPREAAPRPEPAGQERTERMERTSAPRHGRKAEHEDEDDDPPQRAERRRGDGAIDTQAPIPDDYSPASRRAARVEEDLRRIDDRRNRGPRRARRVDVYRPHRLPSDY